MGMCMPTCIYVHAHEARTRARAQALLESVNAEGDRISELQGRLQQSILNCDGAAASHDDLRAELQVRAHGLYMIRRRASGRRGGASRCAVPRALVAGGSLVGGDGLSRRQSG